MSYGDASIPKGSHWNSFTLLRSGHQVCSIGARGEDPPRRGRKEEDLRKLAHVGLYVRAERYTGKSEERRDRSRRTEREYKTREGTHKVDNNV